MSVNPNIIDVTVQNFQSEVLEASQHKPVLLEFYAEGAEQSAALTVTLRKLADEYQGKFLLARVDVQQNSQIVQQLGVRTLPTIKVIFQGQMAHEMEGQQEEVQLREMLDQLTMSPIEQIRAQITMLVSQGDRSAAIEMLQQAIAGEPANYGLHVELSDLLIMESRADEARQILAGLPPETEGIAKPQNRLKFIDRAAELPELEDLQSKVSEQDLQSQYDLAIRLIVDDQIEAALEALLVVLKKDKEFEDQIARKTMIEVFELLGKGDPTATAYRRKMFAFLH
jgi:putative thioredoxin